MLERGTKIVILAGGRGKRMESHTEEKQKCVLPIDGEPALSLIIDELVTAFGSLNLLLAINYKADDVVSVVEQKRSPSIQAQYVYHPTGSESSGAYSSVEHLIKPHEVVLGIPGDVIADSSVYATTLGNRIYGETDIVVTTSIHTDEVDTHGLVMAQQDNPHLVQEFKYPVKPTDAADGYTRDMGIIGFSKSLLDQLRVLKPDLHGSPVSQFIQWFADRNRAGVNPTTGRWLHIGYPQDLYKSWKKEDHAVPHL